MKIYNSAIDLIGNTPLVELGNIEREFSLTSKIFAKVEYFNPCGSVKDRASLCMINEAEKKGLLKKGATIIEPTSGNTGIGMAMIGALRGYSVIIVMPDNMSRERILSIEAYGARVELTPASLGMSGAIEKAKELSLQIEGSYIPSQFDNFDNSLAHYETTGPEIYSSLEGKIDYFVCAFGTGGTISGVARYLKEKNPNIKVVGVEPLSSPFISKGASGTHKIQGIGAGFKPEILDIDLIDEIICVSDEDAYKFGAMLAKKEGLCVGISSGSALCASVEIAKRHKGASIATLFADSGLRYLSVDGYFKGE